jgi:hypothetical protein
MISRTSLELSVLVPFADDEDVLGGACHRLAAHLRALRLPFEILAIDEGSGDNSHALLALLRAEIPELSVIAGAPHRGFFAGATQARGRNLLLIEPAFAARSLAPLAGALARLVGAVDLVHLPGRFVVAKRTRALTVLDPLRARGASFGARIARRAARRGLSVEVWPVRSVRRATTAAPLWERLVGALTASMAR